MRRAAGTALVAGVLALVGFLALRGAPDLVGTPARSLFAQGAGQVSITHETASTAEHRAALETLRASGVMEPVRLFFEAFRLPRPLRIVTRACNWGSGAFYANDTVTVCYGYLVDAIANARNAEKPAWVDEAAAIRGQFLDVFIHEGGHAVFDQLRTPLFAKEEDAADTFASFVILNLFREEAPGLVNGILYSYLVDAEINDFREAPSLRSRAVPSRTYGGAHSTPLQRLYNLVCLASGFDEARFRDLVARSDMPTWRARGCEEEYKQIAHAFQMLIAPHVDLERLRQAFPRSGMFRPG